MELILATASNIFDWALDGVTDVISAITGSPLLLLFAVLPIAGMAIGIVKRLISVN